jgi:hypothetical protein
MLVPVVLQVIVPKQREAIDAIQDALEEQMGGRVVLSVCRDDRLIDVGVEGCGGVREASAPSV